jgi:hypothetical protein
MITLAAKQLLIPAAACLNITRANKGLWTHGKFVAYDFSVCTSTE